LKFFSPLKIEGVLSRAPSISFLGVESDIVTTQEDLFMKTEKITLRISEEEKEKLFNLAKERDIPVSQLIREICREIFNKEGSK